MPDTAIDLDFAGGKYRFWLPMPQVTAIERGPVANKHEGYPRSILAMYDHIGRGLGHVGEARVYIGGGDALVGDVRNIILQGLIGGGSGLVDGEEQKVGPNTAAQLLEDNVFPARPLAEALHLAWLILNAAINGISLDQKKSQPEMTEGRSPSPKGR